MIELVDVAKSYGSKEAVRGVSFTARPGEATGYLGPNGAGKTTTIKMIAGLIRPTQGEIRVCGFDVTLPRRSRSSGASGMCPKVRRSTTP